MTFENLKSTVADNSGLSKAQAGDAIMALIEHIQTTLGHGGKVSLPGLGQFETTERAAREGRNPRTGETIKIPASKGAKFKAGKALKDAVNG